MEPQVTWTEAIKTPQPGDDGFEVPFCRLPEMTANAVPHTVRMFFKDGRLGDDRTWKHHNILGEDEMDDPTAAIAKRVPLLRADDQDLIVVGDGSSIDDSMVIAVFRASTAIN